MSGSSSYNTYESEDESSGWLLTSETSLDDELSDELTLLNGDEDCDENTLSFEALIKLSMRLKKQYNLREAAVQLERCDKIWETMQLVKKMQMDYESEANLTGDEDDEDDEQELKHSPSEVNSYLPEGPNLSVPYIKYQPVQGNGNNALPNFYLAVKSQKKLYNCVTCGKQYSEKRSLALHSQKEHGIVIPKAMKKSRKCTDNKTSSQDSVENKIVNNSSNRDRDNSKSRLFSTSKHITEHQPTRKRERNMSASSFVLPELKEEPEANPRTEETHVKPFVCPICKSEYCYQRGVTKHMMDVHEMTLAEARTKYNNTQAIVAKPLLQNDPSKSQELKGTLRVKEETIDSVNYGKPRKSRIYRKPKVNYIFTCKSCGREFSRKEKLRVHARTNHNIIISRERSPRRNHGEYTREYKFYKCEFVKPSDVGRPRSNGSGKVCGGKQEDKTKNVKVEKNETEQQKTMLSGRQTGDIPSISRPRRACAMNTSYTECTKEEEEVLQRELMFNNVTEGSSKPVTSQCTPCFLCKKVCIDIRSHLKDYHRINCPETILPLTAKAEESEKDNESVASSETVESVTQVTGQMKQRQSRIQQRIERLKEAEKNENIRILRNHRYRSVKDGTIFQCVLCSQKYNRLSQIKKHFDKHMINGVLHEHSAPTQPTNRKKPKVPEDPEVDPLALTDVTDSSRSESRENASDDDDVETTGRKRRISSSDEQLSLSSEHLNKRQNIEKSKEFVNLESESTSDSVQCSNEQESSLVMSETDCGFNEEDKTANPRDTRDSSDRDSGIGISITIKKRNNSYEVVEKDSGDDVKSKEFEHSKDDNMCSDSSSDATPVNFLNDDQQARRREILNSLDYSVEENDGSVRADYEDDNAFGKKSGEENCLSSDKEANFRWKEEVYYGEEACVSLPGRVPSLKVMCRTVLKGDDFFNLPLNDSVSHQCPVCCRFYPTERDVTVHMLEHKVSRTDFRSTRVHVIPSSALRRYGRRPV